MAFVYGLRAIDCDEYFYVGSTKFTLKHRWSQHRRVIEQGRNGNRHFVNKCLKIGLENIVIEALEVCTDDARFERERVWIDRLVQNGVKLTNLIHNGMEWPLVRGIRKQYSLATNWEWAQKWYADYQRNGRFEAINPLQQTQLNQVQDTFAAIIGSILAAPIEDHQRLIERFG